VVDWRVAKCAILACPPMIARALHRQPRMLAMAADELGEAAETAVQLLLENGRLTCVCVHVGHSVCVHVGHSVCALHA
jgi:hypothetical protein